MLRITPLIAAVLGLLSASSIRAGTFSANFDDGSTPAGSAVFGTTVVEPNGGVNDSGALKITKAVNSQSGSFVINDLDAGAPVYGFSAHFKLRIGGGTATPADGFSFLWAPDVPDAPWGEEGTGTGLTVTFDIYDNGGGEAPSIDIKYAGRTLASTKLTIPQITTTNAFEDVAINLRPNGLLDMTYKGQILYTNLPVQGFASLSGARFGFGGRTGGSNANQFVDDLQITTVLQSQVGILTQPRSATFVNGSSTVLSVGINNPDGVAYQWFKNGVAIPGATGAMLALNSLALTDDGAKYRVDVAGPNNTVSSQEAVINVIAVSQAVSSSVNMNFDDAALPPGTTTYGYGMPVPTGGVNDSGALMLTDANNNENTTFMVEDIAGGQPVTGFTATYQMRAGGGTTPPADGFSFNFASDLPDNTFGNSEDGAGTGLTVGFDVYDNGGGEAPSVDVRYGGKLVASTKVPLELIQTGDAYAPVLIQLKNDGTLDVVYNGRVFYHNLPIPGFSSITGGRFAWSARTGGLNENHFVDNITLGVTTAAGPLRLVTSPTATSVLINRPATLTSGVNLTNGVTFQWFRNGTAIAGATSATYVLSTPTLSDDQAKFKVVATGPGGQVVSSDEVALTVADLQAPPSPKLSLNFDSGAVPTGTAVYGNAIVDATGGVNDSGVLKLTVAQNSQNSAFVIDPLEGGAEVAGFTVAFMARVGGGTARPADGFSFNFASDFPNNTIGNAEEGSGSGITISFDIYDNGGGEAPAIDVKYGGQTVASTKLTIPEIETGDAYIPVIVRLNLDSTLDLAYGDRIVYRNLPIPGFKPIANGKFAFAGRTGGANENQWIDNILITTAKPVGPIRIVNQPANQVTLVGSNATFNVLLSDPTAATFQWLRNGVEIPGATSASYTVSNPTAADTNARFSVRVSSPSGVVASQEATLTVIAPITVTNPKFSADFDSGALPAGSDVFGSAFVDVAGGVNDSGVVKLTIAQNDQSGSYYIYDLDAGAAVSAFTAKFDLRLGGGTVPPADGLGFVWGNDVPAGTGFGEDGSGSGLIVGFDIYDNGGGEAPALDIRYHGSQVATTKLPLSQLETGDAFAPVVIRVESDGTLDVLYNNRVIYYNLALPGFTPMANGQFAIGARTGGLNENQWIDNIAISTSTGAAAPRVTIQKDPGGVRIEWTGAGTLQSSADVTGPWTNLPGSSPQILPATGAHRFFRVLAQ